MQTEPVSPAPLRSGKWMVVPAVSPPPPPIEERADVTEHDKQGMYSSYSACLVVRDTMICTVSL